MTAQRFASAKAAPTEVSSILEERIRGLSEEANLNETGRVLSVGYVSLLLCSKIFQKSTNTRFRAPKKKK